MDDKVTELVQSISALTSDQLEEKMQFNIQNAMLTTALIQQSLVEGELSQVVILFQALTKQVLMLQLIDGYGRVTTASEIAEEFRERTSV